MFYLVTSKPRTNLFRITNKSRTINFVFIFKKNGNPHFQSQAYRSFVKRKLKADFSTRGYFINGQTLKKTGRH